MIRSPQHRVLVVDDQVAVAEVVRDALEDAGYAVTLSSTGASGLNLVTHDQPDLVLLDLNLPDIPGSDVLQRLHARWPHIPVIILSGTEDATAQAALSRGAVAYLAKPFSLQRLLETVQAGLTRRGDR